MTREELRSLGNDDAKLTKAYKRLSGISIDITGEDDARAQEVRRIAFDRVANAAMLEGKVVQMRGRPISSFAIDDPKAHRASQDRGRRRSET